VIAFDVDRSTRYQGDDRAAGPGEVTQVADTGPAFSATTDWIVPEP
jgi:hypothetical protein